MRGNAISSTSHCRCSIYLPFLLRLSLLSCRRCVAVAPSIAVVTVALPSHRPLPSITFAVALPSCCCVAIIATAIAVAIITITAAHLCWSFRRLVVALWEYACPQTLGTTIGMQRCTRCTCPHTNPFLTCWKRLLVNGSQGFAVNLQDIVNLTCSRGDFFDFGVYWYAPS